jgi:3-deoxy-manno-octulosonate cytidylyltransferase (CMP-KDO synthetase)
LAKRIEDKDELFSPNVVKVVMDKQGNALYFSRNPMPFMRNLDHDKWLQKGEFYKHIGLYAYKTETLCQIAEMRSTTLEMAESLEQLRWLENGLCIRMGITPYESLSIDTQEDLEKALQYAQNQLVE